MVEQDIIGHLMEVERQAHDLILDAQVEADRRKAAARAAAEETYHRDFDAIISGLEQNFTAECRKSDEDRDREYAEYNARLSSMPLDRAAFNAYIDSVLAGR